jgi:hypothetical protein
MPKGLVGEVRPPYTGKDAAGQETFGTDGLTGIRVEVEEDTGRTPDVVCLTNDARAWAYNFDGWIYPSGFFRVYVPRARIKTIRHPGDT